MLRILIAAIAFGMGMAIWHYPLFFEPGWCQGIACGVAIAWVWSKSPSAAALLGAAGVLGLIAIAVGAFPPVEIAARPLFNGMSLGFMLGWLIVGVFAWPRSGAYLMRLAQMSDDKPAIRLLRRIGIQE